MLSMMVVRSASACLRSVVSTATMPIPMISSSHAHRVVAREPVVGGCRVADGRPVQFDVDDARSRLKHASKDRFELGPELRDHVCHSPAELALDRCAVDAGERRIQAYDPQVAIDEAEADRRRRMERLEQRRFSAASR